MRVVRVHTKWRSVAGRFTFSVHAVQKMALRGISADEVIEVVNQGDVIEDYPQDIPFPSRLLLGVAQGRPLHVVAAATPEGDTVIITVYGPDPLRWDPNLRKRLGS